MHPQGCETTYTQVLARGQRGRSELPKAHRYDRIEILSAGVTSGELHAAAASHTQPDDLLIWMDRSTFKRYDHAEASATLRYRTDPRPPRRWTAPQEIISSDGGSAAIASALASAEAAGGSSISQHAVWQTATRTRLQNMEADERKLAQRERGRAVERVREAVVLLGRTPAHGTSEDRRKHANRTKRLHRLRLRLAKLEQRILLRKLQRRGTELGLQSEREAMIKGAASKASPDPILTARDAAGTLFTAPGQVRTVVSDHWRAFFNRGWDASSHGAERDAILADIAADAACKLPKEAAAALSIESITAEANVLAAVDALKAHSTAGVDGFTPEVYKCPAVRERLAGHLSKFFKELLTRGRLTDDMLLATLTPIYKLKGDRARPDSYRPISTTTIEYRVLTRAIGQQLALALPHVLGPEQAGFLKDRRIGENIDLATAVLEYLEDGGADGTGGVLLLADQAKAFDSVQHDFLDGTLHAFGFPDEFRGIVRTLYNGARTTVKVNGKLGQPFTISAGLRQGCCASPQLYLIVQEVLLRMIRNDTRLRGVRAPGPNGSTSPEHAVELRGRCFADDLMVYLADVDAYVHLRDNLLAPFNRASGHAINFDKTYAIMAGQQAERIGQPHTRTRPSLESVDGDVKFRSLATFDGERSSKRAATIPRTAPVPPLTCSANGRCGW